MVEAHSCISGSHSRLLEYLQLILRLDAVGFQVVAATGLQGSEVPEGANVYPERVLKSSARIMRD